MKKIFKFNDLKPNIQIKVCRELIKRVGEDMGKETCFPDMSTARKFFLEGDDRFYSDGTDFELMKRDWRKITVTYIKFAPFYGVNGGPSTHLKYTFLTQSKGKNIRKIVLDQMGREKMEVRSIVRVYVSKKKF
jgi:hypothetical protein